MPTIVPPLRPDPAGPLSGWRVVVTRAEDQADGLTERLQALGAEPVAYPTIAFAPPDDPRPLAEALRRLASGGYDWLVLTSVNAVRAVRAASEMLSPAGPGLLASPDGNVNMSEVVKVAAVGPTTTAACVELLGVQPAVVPAKFVAEALAEALGNMQGQRVLLANADIARPVLHERLQTAGALVDRVVAYHTVPASGGTDLPPLLAEGAIDAITFTSGSTVRYFVQRIGPEALEHARRTVIACIGPIAADAARAAGLPPTIVASTHTEEGLVAALVAWRQQQLSPILLSSSAAADETPKE
ncbi:MAG: uroporphyrinogen-III synthase [Chloroflexaceae bacterium]|nr:uroporphyrinogen-III synthase [Chloroflexaceae bacterium]